MRGPTFADGRRRARGRGPPRRARARLLFRAATTYLANMHRISEPFDLGKIDVYKETQRRMTNGLTPVIELSAGDGGGLDGATIEVFGTDTAELSRLGTVQREVHVALIDPDSREQHLYPASVVHSGLLAAADASAGGLSFSPRRHAIRQGGALPVLVAERPGAPRVQMQEVGEEASALIQRLDPAAVAILFRDRAPRVKRPVVSGDGQGLQMAEGGGREHPLVAMRVVRRRGL